MTYDDLYWKLSELITKCYEKMSKVTVLFSVQTTPKSCLINFFGLLLSYLFIRNFVMVKKLTTCWNRPLPNLIWWRLPKGAFLAQFYTRYKYLRNSQNSQHIHFLHNCLQMTLRYCLLTKGPWSNNDLSHPKLTKLV